MPIRIILQPYQRVAEACRITGLSQYRLRRGCRDGTVPHVRSGKTYYIDVPALLDKLDADSNSEDGG